MASYNEILDRKIGELERRSIRLRRWEIFVDSIILGLIACIIVALSQKVLPSAFSPHLLYGTVFIPSLIICLIVVWRMRVDRFKILMAVDRRMNLKERLSTAYENLRDRSRNFFLELLVEDAARKSENLDPKSALPFRFPRRTKYIPIVLAIFIGVALIPFDLRSLLDSAFSINPQVGAEGRKIERFGRSLERKAKREELPESLDVARKMQELGRRLQTDRLSRDGSVNEIRNLADEVGSRRQELERRMRASSPSRGGQMSGRGSQDFSSVVSEMLNRMEQGGAPQGELQSMAESLSNMVPSDSLEGKQLQNLVQALRENDMEKAKEILKSLQRQSSSSASRKDAEGLRSAEETLRNSADSLEDRESKEGSSSMEKGSEPGSRGDDSISKKPKGGFGQGFGPPEEDWGDMLPEGSEYSAGVGKTGSTLGEEGKGEDASTQHPQQQSEKIEGKVTDEGDVKTLFIRSLPLKNEAGVTEEEIISEYQKQAEEVISQDDIPLNFRQYIKDYFTSIGMGR
ncbi:MAG: hypothetical protein ACUVXI_05410 [bacterium]